MLTHQTSPISEEHSLAADKAEQRNIDKAKQRTTDKAEQRNPKIN